MFELSSGAVGGGSQSMTSMAMSQPHGGRADSLTFYVGVAALLLSITLQIWRRRRGTCRPVFRIRRST